MPRDERTTRAKIEKVWRNPDGSGRYTVKVLTRTSLDLEDILKANLEQVVWVGEFEQRLKESGSGFERDYKPYVQVNFNYVNLVRQFVISAANDGELAALGVDVR